VRAPARRGLWLAALLAVVLLTPVAAAQEEVPVRVRARYLRVDRARQVAYARGDVVVTYQELVLRADEVTLHLEELELAASGNVVLEEAGQRVTARHLTYNLRTGFGSLDGAETRYLSPRLRDPVHLRADHLAGNLNQRVEAHGCQLTTCDLDDPGVPYKLEAEQAELVPQDKLVLRRASLYLFGRKVLTLPYFVVFLREPRQQRIVPVVGWNETEGWFVKTSTTYFLSDDHYGFLYLDWMERIGTGGGVEHIWKYGAGEGDYFLYVLGNRPVSGQDYRVRLVHRHDFGGGLAAGLFFDLFRRDSPTSPQTNVYGTLDALYRDPEQVANLFVLYSASDAPQAYSDSLQARLGYDRQLGPTSRVRVDLRFTQTLAVPARDLELTPRVDYTAFWGGGSLQATLEHRLDLDGGAYPLDRPFSVSRLPELTYTLAAQTLRLGSVNATYQLVGGLGLFGEQNAPLPTGDLVDRWGARADLQSLLTAFYSISPETSTDLRLSVRGSYYSTGQLRLIVSGGWNFQHRWSPSFQSRLSYAYYDRAGDTPFVFDQDLTRFNLVRLATTYQSPSLTAELAVGYNFVASLPDLVTLRAQWTPSPGWTVDLAAGYDPNAGQLTTAEAQLRAVLSDQWELLYRGLYSPSGGLVHDRVQLTYLQYCWAARLSYLASRQEVWLEAWLTALPQYTGAVGVGQTGVLFQQPFLPPSPVR
jgi:lipopolysaccharide export system protein LptA